MACKRRELNIHEIMRNELRMQGDTQETTPMPRRTTAPIPHVIVERKEEGFKDVYALFESRYRAGGSFENGSLNFNLSTEGTGRPGFTGIISELESIMEMEIYPFSIPNSFITDSYTTSAYYQYHFKTIELYIKEFNRQCVNNVAGDRHHFTLAATPNDHYINLTPVTSKFIFSGDSRASTISFQFLHRGQNLKFSPDTFSNVAVSFLNPARFTTLQNHGLVNNSCVVFPTFTGSASLDAGMQNIYGHLATKINDTTFSIPLSLIGQGPNPALTEISVIERFIEIPMRFRVYLPETTNHITAV